MGSSNNITRRDFIKKSTLGLGGALLMPSLGFSRKLQNQKYYQHWRGLNPLPDEEKLNIALVGLGGYASGQLAPALQETKLCKLNGIVTGTPAKEDRWMQKYGIPSGNVYNYETFDRIADNDDIDIIYIVLPNGMHAEYTIRAAEAGKHVICEKPMATSVKDAEAMIEACNKAGKKLSIGYRLHFEPYNEEAMRLGQNEVLGPVQSMEGANGFTLRDADSWRVDAELAGGGPLMDMGIYVVQAFNYSTGMLPESLTAETETQNSQLFSEVEESIRWTARFPGDIRAEGSSSYSRSASRLRADTSKGWFELNTAFYYSGQSGATSKGPMNFPQVFEQVYQMDAFANCIINDEPSRVPGEMGLRDMKILMGIYEAAETGKPVTFNWK